MLDAKFVRGGTSHPLPRREAGSLQRQALSARGDAARGSFMSCVALRFESRRPTPTRSSDALLEAGALAVDRSDADAGTAGETAGVRRARRCADAAWWPRSRSTRSSPTDADPLRPCGRAGRASAAPASPALESSASPTPTGCALTQAQFEPIRIDERLLDRARPGASRRRPTRVNLALDPGPGVRHRHASDDARCACAGSRRNVRAGALGARLRLRLGHPRDRGGEARRAPRRRRRHRPAGGRRQAPRNAA